MQGDEGRIRSSAGGRAARGLSGRNTQRTELWLPYKARVAFALLGGSSSSRAARLCVCCFLFLTMDRALFISDKSKPKLDSGVADNGGSIARRNGCPTGVGYALAGIVVTSVDPRYHVPLIPLKSMGTTMVSVLLTG